MGGAKRREGNACKDGGSLELPTWKLLHNDPCGARARSPSATPCQTVKDRIGLWLSGASGVAKSWSECSGVCLSERQTPLSHHVEVRLHMSHVKHVEQQQ